jgi:hypothetical protein
VTDDSQQELHGPARVLEDAMDDFLALLARDDGAVYGSNGIRVATFFNHRKKVRKKWIKPGECMHPCCSDKTVRSHAIQREGPLKLISEGDHVLTPFFDHRKKGIGMKKIGIGDASIFPGFCETHDLMFSEFEKSGKIENANHLGLQVFRAVCREVVSLQHQIEDGEEYLKEYDRRVSDFGKNYVMSRISESITIPHRFEISEVSAAGVSHCRDALSGWIARLKHSLEVIKKDYFEQSFHDATGGSDGLSHIMIKGNVTAPVCLSGFGHFGFEVEGNTKEILVILNAWPSSGETMLSVSAPRFHESAIHAYLNSYNKMCLGSLTMLETWMINGTDHWFITPSVWESLPEERKKKVLSDISGTTYNIAAPYPHSIFDALRSKYLPLVSKYFSPADVDREKSKLRHA